MTQDFVLGQLRLALIAVLAYAGGKGWLTPADATLITALGTSLAPIALPWIWSIAVNLNQKLVPRTSVAIQHVDGTKPDLAVGDSINAITKVVGALLLGMILFAPHGAEAAPPAPSGPCNLATLFIGLSPGNFQTRLNACASADFEAALADANMAPVDHMAVSCLDPALKVVQSLQSIADGKTGLITAFQKFRRAKQSGMVGNCVAYVNSTTLLQ